MVDRRVFTLGALALATGMTLAGASGSWAQELREVTVGVVTTAVPFSYLDGDRYTGISNDILQRVAELENLKLNYVPLKFDALIPSLQAGQIDIAVSGIFITEERKAVVDFSLPYHEQGAVLVAPINSDIDSIEDLNGKTIASEQGSAALVTARENADAWGIEIRVLQDAANMQLAMQTGDVDAMIYDSGIMAYQIAREADQPTIKTISDVLNPTGIAFAFQKGSDLTAIVDDGVTEMEENGEITEIKFNYDLQ